MLYFVIQVCSQKGQIQLSRLVTSTGLYLYRPVVHGMLSTRLLYIYCQTCFKRYRLSCKVGVVEFEHRQNTK